MAAIQEDKTKVLKNGYNDEWNRTWAARYELLASDTRADFFLHLTEFTNDIFMHSEAFRADREILGTENVPKVLAAVMTANFNDFNAIQNPEEYTSVLLVAHKKEQLKRDITLDMLDNGVTLGLTDEEQIVVRGFTHMATILDDISLSWRDEVIWSETGRRFNALTDEQKLILPVTLAKLGLDHKFAFLRPGEHADFDKLIAGQPDHGYYEISQMDANREQYQQISTIMDDMISRLAESNGSEQFRNRYKAYFQTWNRLIQSTDLDEIEHISAQLDTEWMQLPDELLVTHPMEFGYYGDDGIRKDLMARLDMIDPREKPLIEICNTQKEMVFTYLQSHADKEHYPILVSKIISLAKTRFLALAPITQVMSYDFKPAGESLPNSDHQIVTDTEGKRVLVYLDGSTNSWNRRAAIWKKVFGDTRYAHDADDVTARDWMIYNLATHETGETVSRDVNTEERLGPKLAVSLNENKSDVSGLAVYGEMAANGALPETEMVKIAKLEVASLLFYLSRWGVPQTEPYHKGGIITANLAIETGLLHTDEQSHQWEPDFTKAKDFLIRLKDFFWENQAPVWESTDTIQAQQRKAALIDPYLAITPGVHELLLIVSGQYNASHT